MAEGADAMFWGQIIFALVQLGPGGVLENLGKRGPVKF